MTELSEASIAGPSAAQSAPALERALERDDFMLNALLKNPPEYCTWGASTARLAPRMRV